MGYLSDATGEWDELSTKPTINNEYNDDDTDYDDDDTDYDDTDCDDTDDH